MRSLALLLLLVLATPSWADARPVTQREIDHAVEALRKDPNLATKETVRTLRWDSKPDDEKKKEKKDRRSFEWPKWIGWLGDAFGWIGETSRMLMWVVIGVLAALLAYFVVRMFAGQRLTSGARRFVPPTHVQDLDIRPESLPPSIGAAARALWDRGEQRAALALLYRGLLSRLAHVHEVPIRDSSTEGDCLTLAARKVDAARLDYATRLIRTWQRAIYGGLSIDTPTVHELCAQFDTRFPQAQATEEPRRTGFASGAPA
jgi:hypothetical protein